MGPLHVSWPVYTWLLVWRLFVLQYRCNCLFVGGFSDTHASPIEHFHVTLVRILAFLHVVFCSEPLSLLPFPYYPAVRLSFPIVDRRRCQRHNHQQSTCVFLRTLLQMRMLHVNHTHTPTHVLLLVLAHAHAHATPTQPLLSAISIYIAAIEIRNQQKNQQKNAEISKKSAEISKKSAEISRNQQKSEKSAKCYF